MSRFEIEELLDNRAVQRLAFGLLALVAVGLTAAFIVALVLNLGLLWGSVVAAVLFTVGLIGLATLSETAESQASRRQRNPSECKR